MKKINRSRGVFFCFFKDIVLSSLLLSFVNTDGGCFLSSGRPTGTQGHAAGRMDLADYSDYIKNMEDISIGDEKGRTNIYAVVTRNKAEKLNVILEKYNDDMQKGKVAQYKNPDFINAPDPYRGDTPLILAICEGYKEVFDILCNNKYIDTGRPGADGVTPLMMAFRCKKSEMAEALLTKQDQLIDATIDAAYEGKTVFDYAMENAYGAKVWVHIMHTLRTRNNNKYIDRIDLGKLGADKSTPLIMAFKLKRPAMAEYLLAKEDKSIDATIDARCKGKTIVHYAVENACNGRVWLQIMCTLLDRIEKANKSSLLYAQEDGSKKTPLHTAAGTCGYKNLRHIVQTKLIERLPQDAYWTKDANHEDPVHIGLKNKQANLIQLLRQASLERLCENDKTIRKNPLRPTSFLRSGLDTPLHIAARLKSVLGFRIILEQIKALAKKSNQPDRLLKELFKENAEKETVWASIVLSFMHLQPISDKTNISLLEVALNIIKDGLTKDEELKILKEVTNLHSKWFINSGITKKYAEKLNQTVSKALQTGKELVQAEQKPLIAPAA